MNNSINQPQQPTLRLSNGNIISHFQISNNVQFPVSYSIDNMATKLVQNEASRKIQDNLTKFMIKYSNFQNINMSNFFNYNGTAIQPIIIYTFYTRENDFNKIDWKPIIQRLNNSNGNTEGLIQKIETIWNSFMKPFSDWIHKDPVVKEEYVQSKLEIEKLIFDQKDKLSVKLQQTIREKYGVNMHLSEPLQAKVDQHMNLMRQQQQQQQNQAITSGGQQLVNTPPPANGKPVPKKRGRKSKKEKEAMLLAQQQGYMNGASFPAVNQPQIPPTAVKKKKKLTKKDIELHNKFLAQEISNQTAYLLQQHTQRTAKIPKIYKNKSIRNYAPINYPLTPVEKDAINVQELQMLRQLEFLKPKLEPNLELPLDISSETLNSLLLLSQQPDDDFHIVMQCVEDLVQLGDKTICNLINKKEDSIELSTNEKTNYDFIKKMEHNGSKEEIKIVVDALTGIEVEPRDDSPQEKPGASIQTENLSFVDDNSTTLLNSQSSDTLSLVSQQSSDIKFDSLQDALVQNFFDLTKPIITENYLQSTCENEDYFNVMKLLTVVTIFRNISMEKTKFLPLNYGSDDNAKIELNRATTSKNNSRRNDNLSMQTMSEAVAEKKISSFPHFFKILNQFLHNCPEVIIKNANALVYTQFMKSWLILTDNICEQLIFNKNENADVIFLEYLINNLKVFIKKNKVQFDSDLLIRKNFVSLGTYVADIFIKLYYVAESNSIIMDDLVLSDHIFIDDLVGVLVKECLSYESINWGQLSLSDFEDLLPTLLQPLNCIQLLLQKTNTEWSNFDDKDGSVKKRVFNSLEKWINEYELINKLNILFQFSYNFMRDSDKNKNKSLPSGKNHNALKQREFLQNKYESMISLVVNILNLIHEIAQNDKALNESILSLKCGFIKKNTLLEIIISKKYKTLNRKLTLLLRNQYALEKTSIL